jgi:hypothetical protein
MNKKYFLISALYALPACAFITENPITLDIPALSAFDHSGMVDVTKIVEFRDKIHKFIIHKIKMASGELYNLEEFVNMIIQGLLSAEQEGKLFDVYTKKFLQVSHTYFNDIRHLKPVLVKMLSTWAHQRNKTDSLVLLWASIDNGKEEQFVKEYTPTLHSFYTFLVDIDMLLLDIMHSCPKSYAHYLACKKIVDEQHHIS